MAGKAKEKYAELKEEAKDIYGDAKEKVQDFVSKKEKQA